MKRVIVDNHGSQWLTDQIVEKMRELGYRNPASHTSKLETWYGFPIGDPSGSWSFISNENPTHAIDEFFALKPEDCQDVKKLTVEEAFEALSEALGYKVEEKK